MSEASPDPVAAAPEDLRRRLAALHGIGEAYHDYRGALHHFDARTRDALLAAMGCEVDDRERLTQQIEAFETARWRTLLPPVAIVRPGHMGVPLALPALALDRALVFRVRLEVGGEVAGTVQASTLAEGERNSGHAETGPVAFLAVSRRLLVLPESLPCGYHTLQVELDGGVAAECRLIVAPVRCFEPERLHAGERLWGLAAQLYTVRSERNWGIGDFADLRELVERAGIGGLTTIALLYRALAAVALDEEGARVAGVPVSFLNVVLTVLAATTVAVSMRIVGILLIAALMVLPVIAATRLARSMRETLLLGMAIGLGSVLGGLTVAYYADLPPGGTIVLIAAATFLVASGISALRRRS